MPLRLRYTELAPEGYATLSSLGHYVNTGTTLSPVLLGLIYLRVSLLNRCDFCTHMHQAELRKLHEPQSRIDAVENWESSDAFTHRERAALAWADTLTRLTDGSHASDEDFAAVTEFFKDKDVVDLSWAIATINAWNRMGVAFRPQWHEGTVKGAGATPNQPAPQESTQS
ncbi:MAG TPA: carboxymuconolactone decarboxylase family protein [Acidobacteriaceae bacterium]|jgi:AhpD family alkylhydroperoxidase